MKSTLEELWHGNICPETDSRTNTLEMKHLMEYMARHHNNLLNSMTDEQKDIFEQFILKDAFSINLAKKRMPFFTDLLVFILIHHLSRLRRVSVS